MTQWTGTKAIIRDVIIVWILTSIGGFLVGFQAEVVGGQGATITALALSNMLLGTTAFCISGCMIQEARWKHLAIVATFCWLTSLVNVIVEFMTIADWISSIVWILIWAGLGGGLSFIVKPKIKK
tara:strand:- start:1454 stop:1828 length:375 start_codon:yes stop_codon:yes gene_type:complete